MNPVDRRKFLKAVGTGTLASALPFSIQKALAVPANNRTGTIADVEHIVILTQENRSFDHYFGSMRGVRGFADPRAVSLSSGKSVWHQPTGDGDLLPFRPSGPDLGMQFIKDVPHDWNDSQKAWNDGKYDQWVPNKGVGAMAYYTRQDIPFHYALADAFTICDAYYCSVMGATDPNRYHLWTGWLGNDGGGGGPVITNAEAGYDWSTYPERLQRAGVSCKIYQDVGEGLDAAGRWGDARDPFVGNYGDNSLLYFHQYRNAKAGEPLADIAKSGTSISVQKSAPARLFDVLRQDLDDGKLPQVSWVVAPQAYSEHPDFPPNYGAWYISQLIEVLISKPEVWSKTVLLINYDEGGGIFDHMVPPTPPRTETQGASTVDTINEIYPGDDKNIAGPYGLGTRVPLIAVSPWSKGGWVNSQVFDHTSIIRFIEARFGNDHPGLFETNITPWRRAVAGDLTSAFNFGTPNAANARLPDTAAYLPAEMKRQPHRILVPPRGQALPSQERGVRPARALPYALHAYGKMNRVDGSFEIDFLNIGRAAAVFHVRSGNSQIAPRSYTVEPDKRLVGAWDIAAPAATGYDLSVYGPNGFMRSFKGGISPGCAELDVKADYDEERNAVTVTLVNKGARKVTITVSDKYTGRHHVNVLKPGQTTNKQWTLGDFLGWYDLVVTVKEDPAFAYRLAGHVETGKHSISDPAMAGLTHRDVKNILASRRR